MSFYWPAYMEGSVCVWEKTRAYDDYRFDLRATDKPYEIRKYLGESPGGTTTKRMRTGGIALHRRQGGIDIAIHGKMRYNWCIVTLNQ